MHVMSVEYLKPMMGASPSSDQLQQQLSQNTRGHCRPSTRGFSMAPTLYFGIPIYLPVRNDFQLNVLTSLHALSPFARPRQTTLHKVRRHKPTTQW